MTAMLVHATTVAIDGAAILLLGPSGSGKSDLALRLIDRGAVLVSDDYTVLARGDDRLLATAPATISGKIEVRGLGIIAVERTSDVPVVLAVRLDRPVERMPVPTTADYDGIAIPEIAIDPFELSAPIKVELALRHAREAS
ncbi:HPr kinase/phosphatase C-terminal domain-containing protein [Sphingomonas sp. TREG-RG-20F-R18-01]|uniref:HPr kinase/phosphorylase n=1 Tax=Sphingomonas sp. TREG-RG-20F-R18-01 TaxID=2914982 RepID=UPI001F58E725|nr:HPr kinase/phosphatase C-terminal domain-containing protein [Sphingomonas sp. TREG-RG-20F-R18-01]